MTESSATGQRVIEIVSGKMGKATDAVTLDMSFVNDLGCDSLDIVELMMDFEDAFDLSISEEDTEKISTLGDAVKYIEEHASA